MAIKHMKELINWEVTVWMALEDELETHLDFDLNDPDEYAEFREMVKRVAHRLYEYQMRILGN